MGKNNEKRLYQYHCVQIVRKNVQKRQYQYNFVVQIRHEGTGKRALVKIWQMHVITTQRFQCVAAYSICAHCSFQCIQFVQIAVSNLCTLLWHLHLYAHQQ